MMLGKHFMHPKYICSYAQPREWKNLIRAKSIEQGWGSLLGFGREAVFLDRIKKAYDRSRQPASQPASLWIQRLQRRSLTGNLLGEELSALLLMQALVLDLVLLILTRIGIGGTGCQLIWSKLKEITYFGPGLTYQDPSILNGSRLLNSQGSDWSNVIMFLLWLINWNIIPSTFGGSISSYLLKMLNP